MKPLALFACFALAFVVLLHTLTGNRVLYAGARHYIRHHDCKVAYENLIGARLNVTTGLISGNAWVATEWECSELGSWVMVATDGTKGWRP